MQNFWQWKKEKIKKLNQHSSIIDTTAGPIEYDLEGNPNDPVVAIMHGAPGGYDQALLEKEILLSHDFRILAWSRPGYLRTPLSSGNTFEKQADALNALIEKLGIQKISLIALSAGGVPALLFAQKYPQKTNALIMEVALSKSYKTTILQRITLFLFFNDFSLWIMETVAKKYPKLVVRFFVNLESSFSAKEKTTITEKALNNKHTLSLFYQFLQTMMPISIRRKGLFNDLSQYKTISNLILEKIQTPTLVIFGKYDADAKPENAFNIKKHMPHAELYEISDGFHFYWFSDHYNEIVEKKISFLKKHSS